MRTSWSASAGKVHSRGPRPSQAVRKAPRLVAVGFLFAPRRFAVREFKVAVCRFPGFNQEHPDSSGWVISTVLKMSKDPAIGEIIPLRYADTPITMTRNRAV